MATLREKRQRAGRKGGKKSRRPRIAKNPQTAKERGKKAAHARKSKYAKGSQN